MEYAEQRIAAGMIAIASGIAAWMYAANAGGPAAVKTPHVLSVSPALVDDPNDPRYDFFEDNRRHHQTFVCPDAGTISAFNRSRENTPNHVNSAAFVALKWGVCHFRAYRLGDSEIMSE